MTYKIGNAAVSLELVPGKFPGLGTSRRVLDAPRGSDDGPVQGQGSRALEELNTP
jgi:hypothetical protein